MSLTQQSSSAGEQPSGDLTSTTYLPTRKARVVAVSPTVQAWDSGSEGGRQEASASSVATPTAIWLGPAAFVLAGIGEYLLFAHATHGAGVALLAVAMLLAVIAFARVRPVADLEERMDRAGRWLRIAWGRALTLRLTGISVAAGLSIGSIVAYLRDPDAVFGFQGVLWLAAMAMLLLSCARWYPTIDDRRWTIVGPSSTRNPQPATRNPQLATRIPHSEALALAALVALSLVTHLAFLDQLPWRLHFDEGFAYIEVMRFYHGPPISLFTTTWVGTSLPSLWFGVEGLLMHITGPNLAGVRLGVALAGALTVLPVYGLGRLLAGRAGAVLSAFAVAVSAVYVHYSRVSIINVTTPLAWAVCFYFLLKGLRSRRPSDFVWAGLAAGLSMYTYYGTRLLPYLLAIFVAYLLVFHFKEAREHLGHFALVAVGFLAGFGPLAGYFILNPDMWASRGLAQLNVTTGIPTSWDAIVADWNILAPLLWKDFLGLSAIPSGDTVYYAPFLLPLEAALLMLGAGVLIWRWRQPASFLVLLWMLGVLFTGGLLIDSHTIPNFAHWTPAFPAFFLALALPLALWWNSLAKVPRRSVRLAASIALALLMALDLAANAYAYIVQYPPLVAPDHSLEAAQGRYVENVAPNTHVRSVGYTWVWSSLDVPIDEMMASPESDLTRFINPSRELPIPEEPGRNLAFLFYNDTWDYLPVVRSYYPGGTAGQVRSPDGTLIGRSYFVPAQVAEARYGVLANFTSNTPGAPLQWAGQVDIAGALPDRVSLSYPLTATWMGAFYIADFTPVELAIQGTDNAQLWVEGEQASFGVPLSIQPGWVRFSLSARLDKPQAVKLLLQQGSAVATPIDKGHLWPMPPGEGLAVTLDAPTSVHRIDPFLGAGLVRPLRSTEPGYDPEAMPLVAADPASSRARWEGDVKTTAGLYTMEIRSDAAFRLTIDGVAVLNMCATSDSNQVGDGQVKLNAGWHHVQIDYQLGGTTNGLEWLWVRPDGVREVVPPSALRLGPNMSPTTPITWPTLPEQVPCR